MNEEVLAAVEGWRQAHGMRDRSEAMSELVILGLMSEIGRIYRLATGSRDSSIDGMHEPPGDNEASEEAPHYGARPPRM